MRKTAWWSAAVTVLVVGPAAWFAWRFDPNDYKPALIDAVREATGRTLALNGPLRVQWSLHPVIEANGVTLANLPGGSRPDMAHAESIAAEISPLALLSGRVDVTKLTLVGPNILFEQVSGASNWVFTPPGGSTPRPAPAASTGSGPALRLRVRTVHIENGMVTWRLPARTKVAGLRTLDASYPVDDGPFDLSAVLVYSDNKPFNLRASAQPTDGFAGPWTTRLWFAAFDTTATAAGSMDVAGTYDFQITAQIGNLDKLNALLPEMHLPALHGVTLDTHVTNGPVPGDLPVLGSTKLHIADGDLGTRLPGLTLGAATVSLPAAGGLATVDAAARYAGQPVRLTGTVGVPTHPDARNAIPVDLKLQAVAGGAMSGSSLAVKGKLAARALAFAGFDGTVAATIPTLTALRGMASGLPALSDVRVTGQLSVPADAGSLRLHDATMATQEGTVSGDATIGLGPRHATVARLHAGDLALTPLLDAFGIAAPSPGPASGTAGRLIPDTPLPWSALHGIELDLQGKVDALTVVDQVWRDVSVAVLVSGGHLKVGTLRTALPAGPLELAVTADATAAAVPATVTLRSPGVPLALIARYAGLPGSVSGAIALNAQLHGNAATLRGLAASLDGPFSATAVGGTISNAALVKLTSAALEALGITVPPDGETVLRCLGLAGSFRNGVGRLQTIALETTYLSLEAEGVVDLGQETVALTVRPLAQVAGSPVEVKVVVDGPFRAITGRLDATGLDKVGLMFDGLFGGDTSKACAKAGLTRPVSPP